MYQPLVTLALVSYCHEPYLKDALYSVLQQDYPALEIFVVDDHSADASVAIIQDFVTTHQPDWTVELNTKNKGFCANLNSVLAKAQGEFLFVLAGDDYMAPNRVSSLVKRVAEVGNQFAVVYSDCEIVDENKKIIAPSFIDHYAPGKNYLPEGKVLNELIERNFICNTAVLMRVSALKKINGFDENLVLEDYSTWLKLADAGYMFAAIKEKNFSYRLLRNSTLRTMGVRYYEDIFKMMTKFVHEKNQVRKHVRKNIYLCCKHAFYKDSKIVKEMFDFFFRHFGFNLKLVWLYLLHLAGIKGTAYRSA